MFQVNKMIQNATTQLDHKLLLIDNTGITNETGEIELSNRPIKSDVE